MNASFIVANPIEEAKAVDASMPPVSMPDHGNNLQSCEISAQFHCFQAT
jgi:hypothetical protein